MCQIKLNSISSVMVSMLPSSVVGGLFPACLCQTKDYKIGYCCFSAKHAAFTSKSKDWLALNQVHVSEWTTYLSTYCCFRELTL